jgi:ribosome-associated protein
MDDLISKSQKKRDALALQAFGKKLTELSKENLDKLPLAPDLKDAILFGKTIKSFGALKRHMQLIGKLMRRDDPTPIIEAYDNLLAIHQKDNVQFHEVEHWRAYLISGGRAALTEFITQYTPKDIQSLRQHIAKAVQEHQHGAPVGASRALFRFIRSIIL